MRSSAHRRVLQATQAACVMDEVPNAHRGAPCVERDDLNDAHTSIDDRIEIDVNSLWMLLKVNARPAVGTCIWSPRVTEIARIPAARATALQVTSWNEVAPATRQLHRDNTIIGRLDTLIVQRTREELLANDAKDEKYEAAEPSDVAQWWDRLEDRRNQDRHPREEAQRAQWAQCSQRSQDRVLAERRDENRYPAMSEPDGMVRSSRKLNHDWRVCYCTQTRRCDGLVARERVREVHGSDAYRTMQA